jgi:thymidylate synthase
MEQVQTQQARTPKPLPQIRIKRDVSSIFDFRFDDFEILNYDPDPIIKAPVAV